MKKLILASCLGAVCAVSYARTIKTHFPVYHCVVGVGTNPIKCVQNESDFYPKRESMYNTGTSPSMYKEFDLAPTNIRAENSPYAMADYRCKDNPTLYFHIQNKPYNGDISPDVYSKSGKWLGGHCETTLSNYKTNCPMIASDHY